MIPSNVRRAAVVVALVLAATASLADTQVVVITEKYRDPPGGTRLFGELYRDLWATPVALEVLDMGSVAGGLVPMMRVGGFQTPGLALSGADGRSYTFRGAEKNVREAIPVEFQNTGMELIVQDMMSSSIPGSDVLVPPLADAVGVLTVEPRLVVLPDDERLGEFREDFAGVVGIFYQFPTAGFAGSTAVLSPAEFLEARRAGTEGLPDTRAFLRARLLDLLIGDWDRHYKQWRWVRIPGLDRLQPIPEDRDQAFSVYDGVAMDVIRFVGAQMVEFRERYASTERMIRDGADHDRFILADIGREEWMTIAEEVAAAISDTAIRDAVDRLPEEYRVQVGDWLIDTLSARRKGLPAAASRFYEMINRQVDVHGTDRSEFFDVEHLADGEVEVRVAVLQDGEPLAPYFVRRFRPAETGDVRLYLHGGSDRVLVRGEATHAIRVRAIAGSPDDRVDDELAHGVKRYDFADQPAPKRKRSGPAVQSSMFTQDAIQMPDTGPRDWGGTSKPMTVFDWHRDPGIILGGGMDWKNYRFRKLPWSQRHRLSGALASRTGLGFVEYDGDFRPERGVLHAEIEAIWSGIEQLRYYGLGNETSDDLGDSAYRIDERRVTLFPALARDFGTRGILSFGPVFHYSNSTDTDDNTVLAQEQPYGFGTFAEAGLLLRSIYDSRDHYKVLQPGVQWGIEAAVFPPLGDVVSTYGYLGAEVGWHRPLGRPVLGSFFVGGRKLWGDFPFFQAAYLGGHRNAIGYTWNRFAGESSLYGSAQFRWSLAKIRSSFPGELGLTTAGDVGRVFVQGESSRVWHPSLGLGVFFAGFDRLMLFEFGVGIGPDETFVTFRSGIRFSKLR
jgi:hypothetical protein